MFDIEHKQNVWLPCRHATCCLSNQLSGTAGVMQMAAAQPSAHIALLVIWEVVRGSMSFTEVEAAHLMNCEDCVGIVGICRVARSFEHAERLVCEELGQY